MSQIDHFRTFMAIYRAGTLSVAAEQLCLTQPAVSGHLKSLEAVAGKPLFVRERRGVRPTSAGIALARKIEPLIDGLEKTYQSMRQDAQDLAGTVHVGGPVEFMSTHVLPALADTADTNIQIRIELGQTDALIERLKRGELDMVIATQRLVGRQLDYSPIFQERFSLVGDRRWFRPSLDLRELLHDAPLIAYDNALPIVRRYLKANGFSRQYVEGLHAKIIVEDLRAVQAAVRAGAGITVLPDYLCRDDMRSGRLVRLYQGASETPPNTLYLAHLKSIYRSPRTVFVKEHLLRKAAVWDV